MNQVRLKILPPWSIYIKKLEALFESDPQATFNVDWSGKHPSVVISTNNGNKNAALLKLLPSEKNYGNVTLTITIDGPVADIAFISTKELFETAFSKNPVFAYCVCPAAEGYWYIDYTYVVFKNYVVQFFADNLNDVHGVISTLYQDLAAEIFEDCGITGVAYCTDTERKVGKPLGEWP